MATAGLLADGKHLAGRGRDEAANFRDTYNSPVTVAVSSIFSFIWYFVDVLWLIRSPVT